VTARGAAVPAAGEVPRRRSRSPAAGTPWEAGACEKTRNLIHRARLSRAAWTPGEVWHPRPAEKSGTFWSATTSRASGVALDVDMHVCRSRIRRYHRLRNELWHEHTGVAAAARAHREPTAASSCTGTYSDGAEIAASLPFPWRSDVQRRP